MKIALLRPDLSAEGVKNAGSSSYYSVLFLSQRTFFPYIYLLLLGRFLCELWFSVSAPIPSYFNLRVILLSEGFIKGTS